LKELDGFLEPLPDSARQVLERIEASQRPLIASHLRLDGDALGAELALAHMLRDRGARPTVVNESPIPQAFRFLPGVDQVGTCADCVCPDHDLAVILDTPTWGRARGIRERLAPRVPVVSIDHHPPLERMGDVEWVDVTKSSVGEMIYLLARAGNWPLSAQAATCLYTAILTDTGRFTFPNTTPSALRAAAHLIELGADHVRIAEKIYQQESPGLMALRAEVIRSLRLHAGGRIAVMSLTRDMLRRAGVDPIDTQELAEIPRSVAGAVVGVLLREMSQPGMIKVSLRSRNGLDIEPVARKFGGGGHHEAAGCELDGSLREVEQVVVKELIRCLEASGLLDVPSFRE